jgi:PAS domain S-box-containing protein
MKIKDLILTEYLLWEEKRKIPLNHILKNKISFVLTKDINKDFVLYRRDKILAAFLDNPSQKAILLAEMVQPEMTIVLEEDKDYLSFPWISKKETVAIIIDQNQEPVGILENARNLSYIASEMKNDITHRDLALDYYRKIIDTIEEEILITDEYGFIQFVNPWAVKVSGSTKQELVGKHMSDYEKACIVDTTSIALDVLKNHKKVHKMMKMVTGRVLIATGIPIYDEHGRLTNAMSTSKDIEEIASLFEQLTHDNRDGLIKKQEQEIIQLKECIIKKDNVIMISKAMQELQSAVVKIAPKDVTVLIEGESGTGKEVICKLIHKLSARHENPLVKINCGAIPEHLLESELFGYEPGAFTGAHKNGKIGILELGHHGTIFLDEIGEMPLTIQVKLLEFLQDRKIIRLGGVKKIPIDTRVIAATNKNLKEMIAKGKFRGDLYYRLNVVPLKVPPLREREADIIPMAQMFLERFNSKHHLSKSFSRELMQSLLEYDWPGNVRELMHVIERLVLISEEETIGAEVFENMFNKNLDNHDAKVGTESFSLKQAKKDFEFRLVRKAYEKYRSTYKAGEYLGINQSTVVKILKRNKYNIGNSKGN